MSDEFFTPQSRNEAILQNICGANNVLPDPQSRIEKLLQAILYEDETIVDFTPESRAELLLYAILTHGEYDAEPQSRNEAILQAILTNGEYDALPQSRIEALLIEWLDQTHYEEKTVSGDVVSINDAVDAPVVDLTAAIVPVQSGSGDPSPTNIRPISGWTGAKVTRTGGNQLRNNSFNSPSYGVSCAVQTDDCVAVLSGTATQTIGFTVAKCQVQKGSTYTVSVENPNQNCVVNVRKMFDNAYVGMVMGFRASGTATFTVDETFNAVDVRPTVDGGVSVSNCVVKYSLAIGSTATAYEPYQGESYEITFPTEAGTVYGGTIDVTTGKLTVDRAMVDLGTLNWRYFNIESHLRFVAPLTGVEDVSSSSVADMICSMYTMDTANNVFNNVTDKRVGYAEGNLFLYDSDYTDATVLKTAITGQRLVYKLATPLVYHLSPVEIRTLAGQNTIWADTGDVTVRYKARRTAAGLMMMAGRL